MTLYHCTGRDAAKAISASQMQRGSQGMLGGAIYFAKRKKDAMHKCEHGRKFFSN